MAEAKKHARRLALLDAAGGVEPLGTGSPCADCAKPGTRSRERIRGTRVPRALQRS